MRWLSSQQSLADIAAFRDAMCPARTPARRRAAYPRPLSARSACRAAQYNLTEKNVWVAFGGSYAGALTAWVRIKYPHLIYASISSSAPVHAVLDFQAYNEVVANSLATPLVGGSPECTAAVSAAFDDVKQLLQTPDGQNSLSAQFNTCTPLANASALDTQVFWGDLSGIFQGPVQYNDEMPGALNISVMCQFMLTQGYTPLQNLARLSNFSQAGTCQDISYADQLAQLNNTVVNKGQTGVGLRQWTYQTCAQFGYFQTCDDDTKCVPAVRARSPGSRASTCAALCVGVPSRRRTSPPPSPRICACSSSTSPPRSRPAASSSVSMTTARTSRLV